MKRKMIAVVLLVFVCAGILVVRGVSQPPVASKDPLTMPGTAGLGSPPAAAFNRVEPRLDAMPQHDLTFDQLAEALKGVRARQKELKAQEADILAKLADKIEEKRKDLQQAEDVLRQLQGSPTTTIRPRSLNGSGNPPVNGEESKARP